MLRDFTAGILNDWKVNVLEAHLDVVGGQYDAAGLAMLSRQLTDPLPSTAASSSSLR